MHPADLHVHVSTRSEQLRNGIKNAQGETMRVRVLTESFRVSKRNRLPLLGHDAVPLLARKRCERYVHTSRHTDLHEAAPAPVHAQGAVRQATASQVAGRGPVVSRVNRFTPLQTHVKSPLSSSRLDLAPLRPIMPPCHGLPPRPPQPSRPVRRTNKTLSGWNTERLIQVSSTSLHTDSSSLITPLSLDPAYASYLRKQRIG